MTREAKTRKAVEETTVVVEQEKTEFELGEEEIPGTRCDFCDQWYGDEEPVEMMEMVENPSVSGVPDDPLRLGDLLRYLTPREITSRPEAYMAGSAVPVGFEARKTANEAVLLQRALRNFVEARGGPRRDPGDIPDSRNIAQAAANSRTEAYDIDDIIFNFDFDLEVDGETHHMCEYCRGSRKNE